MKILLTPEEWTLRYYPQNNYDTNYKLSNYIVKKECGNEIVLLHTITWSIYALTKEEFDNILTNETLRRAKVVVPESLDELEVAHKVYLDRLTPTGLPTLEGINDFTVLTTTSCNARCFYCYEKDLGKKQTMTLDTAEDVLQFILKKRDVNNPNLNIQWFGGEPLLNKRVIEYITDRLYELNVPFSTSMITNGFLLDEETVKKFNYWKIRMVQLTFDGLEEEYNEIKNFIYSDVDAYLTLINNIHNLLKYTTARIVVKFNATNENIFKIYDYLKYLQEEYSCHENHHQIHYTVSTLFEYIKDPDLVIDGYWDEFYRIGEIADVRVPNIRDKILSEETYKRKPINFQCKAYDGRTFIIMPNGDLVRCGLVREKDIYGNIYDGVTNMDVINAWHNFDGEEIQYCKDSKCPLHPMCPKFFRCNSCGICFKQEHIDGAMKLAEEKLFRTYDFYEKNVNKS